MTLINSAMLFGLLVVVLPVAIHLLTKPRLRVLRWAASRFLLQSLQKNKRRLRAEDLLLLLLRCLMVALLALLFARPAFLTNALAPQVSKEASTDVVVLDNSESMGQSDGTRTRFDQAKGMIDDIVSKLGAGSSCAFYLDSDHAKAVIAKPTRDFALLRRSVTQAPLSDGGSDLFPGLQAAVNLLKTQPVGHREIFVLTDSQSAAWVELGNIRQLVEQNKKEIAIHFLLIGDKGEDNLAVSALQMSGTVAVINQPLRCTVQVSNWGRTAVERIPVKLATDDQPPQDEGMIDRIEPGSSKTIALFARLKAPGYHSITASIPGDRLPADNQRSIALLALEQVRALVVEGTSNPDPTAHDGFFLGQALTPVRPDQLAQYYVKVATGPASELDNSTVNQYEMIFLSNVAQLDPLGAQNLRQYVNQGGALVVFPGPATDVAYYDNDPNFSTLLPAKLDAARDAPAAQPFLGWQSKDYEHPVTTLWNAPESGNLAGVHTSRYFPLTMKPGAGDAPPAQVVVKYTNGEPAAVSQQVGKGNVFLFSSTATTEWTTLPIHPAFVPLLMRIMAATTKGLGGNLDLVPGQPFVSNVDSACAGRELFVLRPGESKRRLAGAVETGVTSAVLRYNDTERAGAYQLFVGDDPQPKVVFTVQSDPKESNLAQQPRTDLEPLLTRVETATAPEPISPGKPAADLPRVPGQELWYPLAIALLLMAMVETALAHRFSQPK